MTARPSRPADPEARRAGSRREEAARVRAAIVAAAEDHFRRYGYDRASLAEIGAAVGLTRGAVLYHFASKPALLGVLLGPFVTGLDAALEDLEQREPAPPAAMVIDTLLDLLTANRPAADLLARDIASRHALDLDAWFTTSARRLVRLLEPDCEHDQAAEARGYATLGAVIRPLMYLPDPLTGPAHRAIRTAALNAHRRPRTARG